MSRTGFKLTPDEIQQIAQAVAKLNAEPDRPATKIACEEELALRLGLPWPTVKHRIANLRLRVVPRPKAAAPKSRFWGKAWP